MITNLQKVDLESLGIEQGASGEAGTSLEGYRIDFMDGLCSNRDWYCRVGWGQKEEIRLREEIQGETAGIKGHLREDMKTSCSRNPLK